MNRFKITKGMESQFEDRWKKRQSFLSEFEGFMSFWLLKSETTQDKPYTEFISHSHWRDEKDFGVWMEKGAKKSHAQGDPPPQGMFQGPPEFTGYSVVLNEGRGHRTDFRSSLMDSIIEKNFSQETEGQKKLMADTLEQGMPAINVGALEGKILEVLLRSIGAKRGVEVGTLGGYSASWIARALPDGGKLTTIEKDPKRAEEARANLSKLGLSSKVEVLEGDAHEVLKNLDLRELDFVFIDADKAAYPDYVDWAIPRLRKGGLLLCDNSFIWGGMLYYGSTYPKDKSAKADPPSFVGMSETWDKLKQHPQLSSVILPTGEGLAVAVKI